MEVIRMGKFIASLIVASIVFMTTIGPKKATLWMFKQAAKAYEKGPISHSQFTRQLTSR